MEEVEIYFLRLDPEHGQPESMAIFLGAFVIPFLIMMLLEGMPILLLELGIGQKLRTGNYPDFEPKLGPGGYSIQSILTNSILKLVLLNFGI